MHTEQAIKEWLENIDTISSAMSAILSDPDERQSLYKALVDEPPARVRKLLLRALEHEVAFRHALFNGECADPIDRHEGIQRCAFLLYRAGEVADTLALWSAKHIDMDVSSSLGAEYFFGAGIAETIAFFDGWSDSDAVAMLDFLNEFLAYDAGWSGREQWELEQTDRIRRA